jgi:hypothetical protein
MKGGQISTKAGQFLPGQFSEIQISTSTSGKNRLLGGAEDAPNPPPLLGEFLLADAMERGAVRARTLGARGREMNPEHKGT